MELEPTTTDDDIDFRVKPHECLATNLQLLFTLMKETVRKSINPEFFVKAIGLDASEQQVFFSQKTSIFLLIIIKWDANLKKKDAQEFSQLFLTILQNTFSSPSLKDKSIIRFPISSSSSFKSPSKSSSTSVNLINDLFQGECSYITELDLS